VLMVVSLVHVRASLRHKYHHTTKPMPMPKPKAVFSRIMHQSRDYSVRLWWNGESRWGVVISARQGTWDDDLCMGIGR